jgi:hypothetical protein
MKFGEHAFHGVCGGFSDAGFVVTAAVRLRIAAARFTFTARGRGWLALAACPPGSCRVRFPGPDDLRGTSSCSASSGLLGPWTSPLVSFTSPSKTHCFACGSSGCVPVSFPCAEAFGLLTCSSCELPLLGFSKTVPPSTCASDVHSHTTQAPCFGQGLPAPRLVPSMPFLTTSTACSI